MAETFLFVGMPYLAVVFLILGSYLRYRSDRFGFSALSSQILESRLLPWGSIPWHAGILIVLVGHLLPLLAPGPWQALVSEHAVLVVVEAVGLGAALAAGIGLTLLLVRRVLGAPLQRVTSVLDLVVVGLLLAQVALGIGVAHAHRWGASWSAGTTTPYLWSLLTLQPRPALVTGLPALVQVHLVVAWLIFLLVPFSRLVHLFSIPVGYLVRPYLKVIWASRRRLDLAVEEHPPDAGRRLLVQGLAGAGAAVALLGVGVAEKLLGFFSGPEMSLREEADLLGRKIERLEQTAQQRELQLERLHSERILVARLGDLSPTEGHYFIDYEMRPALAFRGPDGLPLLISAECTHLGCTVSREVDSRGRLFCPCHVSYFDLETGEPEPGSPADAPLPRIGWELVDAGGETVASARPGGPVTGDVDPQALEGHDVYIARRFAGGPV